MDETKTIDLPAVIKVGKDEFAELTLREPTAGEFGQYMRQRAAGPGEGFAAMTKLIGMASNIGVAGADRLPLRVRNEAEGFIAGFLADTPPTGGASSGD